MNKMDVHHTINVGNSVHHHLSIVLSVKIPDPGSYSLVLHICLHVKLHGDGTGD